MKKMILILTCFTIIGCKQNSQQQTEKQTQPTTQWNRNYGGVDKSYDTELLNLREKIAPKFQKFTYYDENTGIELVYHLYIPNQYDEKKAYPLVMFIPDASTVGKAENAGLMQGYGGIIWATDESQKENPCFVLVPYVKGPESATNDQWQVSQEGETIIPMLLSVVEKYNIDKQRIYTTGQSMGGMLSFHFNVKYPNLFAASLFVGCQWDTNLLSILKNESFFYVVSAGDPKASVGMESLKTKFDAEKITYAFTQFSAQTSLSEQNAYIKELLKKGNPHNFVLFEKGTTLPNKVENNTKSGEHMYSFDYAYKIKAIRDWLLQQKNKTTLFANTQ